MESWKEGSGSVHNGVFDLLHPGHIDILTASRETADALVVDIEMIDQVTGKTLWQRKGLLAEGQYEERGEPAGRKVAIDRIVNTLIEGAQSQW